MNHLDYMKCIEEKENLEQLYTQLMMRFPTKIQQFGQRMFKKLLACCEDQNLVMSLVAGELTVDQFATRVNAARTGVSYTCFDDLVEQGIIRKDFEFKNVDADTTKQNKRVTSTFSKTRRFPLTQE